MTTVAPPLHRDTAPPTWRFRNPRTFLKRFQTEPLEVFGECRTRFGDATRLSAPLFRAYALFHPDHVRHVLLDHHRRYSKGRVFARLRRFAGNGLLFSEGDFWLRQRRMAAPAFHHQAVAKWADLMAARAEALADRLEAQGTTPDLARDTADLALDIVAAALFGSDVEGWKDAFAENMAFSMEYSNHLINTLFPAPIWVPTRRNRRMRQAMAELDVFLDEMIGRRRRSGGPDDDLLAMLLAARDDATHEGMTDRQVRDECVTFVSAGHETTAMTLAWGFALLAQHPDVEARLFDELDRALGGRRPGLADLDALPFTRRVVDETLRLYPPAWGTAREALEPDDFGDFTVEPREVVFLSPYITQRHPDFWETPDRFDPDRFLPERAKGRPRYAYWPFGAGARLCIGREFALLEAVLVLATVARRLRLRLADGHQPRARAIFTLRPAEPMPMRVERR